MRRIRNTTTIPDEIVREIETFVMPPGGVWSYDLELRNSRAVVAADVMIPENEVEDANAACAWVDALPERETRAQERRTR